MDKQHEQAVNNADTVESKSEYEVGDIVWAKLNTPEGCPFCPGIVTYNGVSRLCMKSSSIPFWVRI